MREILKLSLVTYVLAMSAIFTNTQADSISSSEQKAFELYDQINSTDIALGELALSRSRNASVHHLGAMMTNDHANIRHQARNIARKYGLWSHPPGYEKVIPKFAGSVQNLRAVSDENFDASYMAVELEFSRDALHMKHILMAEKNLKIGADAVAPGHHQ